MIKGNSSVDQGSPKTQPNAIYDLGDSTFNATHGELHSKITDEYLHIEKKVAEVFQCLAQADGEVVTRQHIFSQVWPNLIVSDDSLNRCISVLRKKLKSFDHGIKIKTHPKIGFNLIFPIDQDCTYRVEGNEQFPDVPVQENTIERITPKTAQQRPKFTNNDFSVKNRRNYFPALYLVFFAVFAYWILPSSPISSDEHLVIAQLDERRNVIMPFNYPAEMATKYQGIEEQFRHIIANHPMHYLIDKSELSGLNQQPATLIGQRFNARFVIRANAYQEEERDILNWQIVDAKTGDELTNQKINLALNSNEMNVRILASNFVAANAHICFKDDVSGHIDYILASAAYLFSPKSDQVFQQPVISLLAQTLSDVDPNSVPTMLMLSKFIMATSWPEQRRNHAYINLAIKTLKKAIAIEPTEVDSYYQLANVYMVTYQWQLARQVLLSIPPDDYKQNSLTTNTLFPLNRLTGQLTNKAIEQKEKQYLGSPTDLDLGKELILLYIEQQQFSQALKLANSLPIANNAWQQVGAILGPIYLALGNTEKGREITSYGYQSLGVSSQYIDVFLQGLQHKKSAVQASNFLQQTADNGEIATGILLQMYEQLGNVEGYFKLALRLAKNNQYDVLTSRRYNASILRKDVKFEKLMTEVGLTHYWQIHGSPFFAMTQLQQPTSSL